MAGSVTRRLRALFEFQTTGDQKAIAALNRIEKQTKDVEKASQGASVAAHALGQIYGQYISGFVNRAQMAVEDFLRSSVQEAAHVEEMGAKFTTVFRDQAADVVSFTEQLAKSINRSAYDLQEYASMFQDTFVPLGFAREEATKMSKRLVELTEDLGSFNDIASMDVARDLQTALVGNTMVLRKYGVVAQETQIQQKALEMGIWDGKGAIDAQSKAMAIMEIIVDGTADAQGDAARTADSFTNSMRGLESSVKDVKVALGQLATSGSGEAIAGAAEAASTVAAWLTVERMLEEQVKKGNMTMKESRQIGIDVMFTSKTWADVLEDLIAEQKKEEAAVKAITDEYADQDRKLMNLGLAYVEVAKKTAEITDEVKLHQEANQKLEPTLEEIAKRNKKIAAQNKETMDSYQALQRAITGIIVQGYKAQLDPIKELFDAREALAAAEGEWAQQTINNSATIQESQNKLAEDLTADQVTYWEDVKATAEEGGAEWLDAYERLQADLTDSQREEEFARLAGLQETHGQVRSIYTGDAAAAEEAQGRIDAAMEAVKGSYQEAALAMIQLRLADKFGDDWGAVELVMTDIKEEMGLIDSDEAEFMRDRASRMSTLQAVVTSMLDEYQRIGGVSEEESAALAAAIDLVNTKVGLTPEGFIAMAEKSVEGFGSVEEDAESAGEIIEEQTEKAEEFTETLEELDGQTFVPVLDLDISYALSKLQEFNDSVAGAGNSGGGYGGGGDGTGTTSDSSDGYGGQHGLHMIVPPGYHGDTFGPFWASSGEEVTITPRGQRGAGGGRTTVNNVNVHNHTREAVALFLASMEVNQRASLDEYMGIR